MKSPMLWRRHRDTAPALTDDQLSATWQVISLLLDYPSIEVYEHLRFLHEILDQLPEAVRLPLAEFVDDAAEVPLAQLQQEYVDVFDVTRRCSLHLTYFTHGDTRRRGVALVDFKAAYRRAGMELADESAELPDHLPIVLEFGAYVDRALGWKLLNDHRVGIELLHRALTANGSRWASLISALRATLPSLGADDDTALAKLIADGPPSENVGLDTSPYSIDPRLNPHPEPIDLGSRIPVGAPR